MPTNSVTYFTVNSFFSIEAEKLVGNLLLKCFMLAMERKDVYEFLTEK